MKTVYLVIALALAGIGAAAQAAVTATLSSQQIGAGDTVQLEVHSDSRHGGAPDLAPLERDFRVLGTSSGSSIQVVNGSMSVTAQVQVVLQPKHAGVLQIPPLRWDDETTPALALTVSAGAAPSAGNASAGAADTSNHVRVEATLAPGPVYVGGAALLTVRVLTDQPLDQAGLDAPANADLALQQIGTDQQIRETRDGNAYQGIVRYYLVRPQRSGALVLPGPVLTAQVEVPGADPFNDPFFARAFGSMRLRMPGARRTVQIKAKDIALAVRPRPASVDGKDWLPAASLTLAADAGPAAGTLRVGDPLTLHLQLRATGTAATQLPDLSGALALPDGLKAYPDQPKLGLTLAGSDINASRDQDVALIASRPGRYTVPALAVRWWDVHAGVARVAQVPARVIDVLPALAIAAPAMAAAAPVAAPQQAAAAPAGLALSRTAIWIAGGVALLLVLMAGVWWWRRRAPRVMAPAGVAPRVEPSAAAPEMRPDAAMRAVRASAAANDADATRRALLALAAVSWPTAAPSGLHALAAQLAAPLRQEVEALDRACYTGLAWQGAALAQALDQWPQAAAAEKQGAGIADLYL